MQRGYSNLLLAALFFSTGCVRATALEVRSGATVRGDITSSDAEHVYVRTVKNMKPRAVPRKDIVDVDHSGSAARFIGIPIALVGAAAIAFGFISAPVVNCEDLCIDLAPVIVTLGIATLVPGLVTSIVGFIEYGNSTKHFGQAPARQRTTGVMFGIAPIENGGAAAMVATF